MKRRHFFNQAFSIMMQNSALWIVTLGVLSIYTISSLILSGRGLVLAIVELLVSFAITAFLPAALVKMVDSIAE